MKKKNRKSCSSQVHQRETTENDLKESQIVSTGFETCTPVEGARLPPASATRTQPHGASVIPYQYHLFSNALLSAWLRSQMSKAASHPAINANSPWQTCDSFVGDVLSMFNS